MTRCVLIYFTELGFIRFEMTTHLFHHRDHQIDLFGHFVVVVGLADFCDNITPQFHLKG